jgi:acetyl esterase/lipase
MDLSTLDPQIAAILAAAPGFDTLGPDTLAARRAVYPAPITVPLSDTIRRTDRETGAPGSPIVRIHRPVSAVDPLPCLYWMHGGGLVLGDRFQDDLRFDKWCQRHQIVAVSVEYRLAPETPFPGPLDDCHAGLQWTYDHAAELGIDPDRIGIGGASAGAGLAAALALLARDRRSVEIAFQLLIYPMLDDRQITRSSRVEVPVWPPSANAFGWRSYLGGTAGTDTVSPYAAAARATDLTRLPPAFITVGGLDGFVDENIDYATRLNHAGVPTDLRVYPGLPHGFDAMAPGAAATRRAQNDLHEWLARALRP